MIFAQKYKFLFFYSMFVILTSLILTIYINPENLIVNQYINKVVLKPSKPVFFVQNPMFENELEFFDLNHKFESGHFRGGARREGYYETNMNLDSIKIEKLKDGPVINYGAHSASKSSPIIGSDYILIAGDYGLVQVLDKKNLKEHWRINLFDSVYGLHSTPIVFKNYAIIGDYSGTVYFLNLKKKKIIWSINLGSSIGASPYFDGRYLYVNVETNYRNGFLVKIDMKKTKIVWMSNFIGNHSHSSPALNKDSIFIGDNDGHFYSFSKKNGKVKWIQRFLKPIKSTPVLFNNLVIFSSWNGYLYALNQDSGALSWSYKLESKNQSSMAINKKSGTGVINDLKGILKIDLLTGKRVDFLKIEMDRFSRKASPVIIKNKSMYFTITPCAESSICLIDFKRFEILKSIKLEHGVSGQVGVSEDKLFFVSDRDSPLLILR